MAKGPGTLQEQIASLENKMTNSERMETSNILLNFSNMAISLAYKQMRLRATSERLPKAVTKLLSNLSEEDAAAVRATLEKAIVV